MTDDAIDLTTYGVNTPELKNDLVNRLIDKLCIADSNSCWIFTGAKDSYQRFGIFCVTRAT
jgi:hypothetical protein